MQGTRFTVSYHTAGTLAANHSFIFKVPFDCQLIGVSAVASNASSGILDVGYTGALEAYVLNMDVGDSSVAAILDEPTDFVGEQLPPHRSSHQHHLLPSTMMVQVVQLQPTLPWCSPSRRDRPCPKRPPWSNIHL